MARGDALDRRVRSSTDTGAGLNNDTTCDRSLASGSKPSGESPLAISGPRVETSSPMIGCTAEMISAASVTGVAPCLSKPLVPSARGSSGEPGTANTSRPCSSARRAVMSEPERLAASTMTMPNESPEINRLRRGKSRARGSQPNGISVTATPVGKIASMSSACSGG